MYSALSSPDSKDGRKQLPIWGPEAYYFAPSEEMYSRKLCARGFRHRRSRTSFKRRYSESKPERSGAARWLYARDRFRRQCESGVVSRRESELLGWTPVERRCRDTVGEVMREYLRREWTMPDRIERSVYKAHRHLLDPPKIPNGWPFSS